LPKRKEAKEKTAANKTACSLYTYRFSCTATVLPGQGFPHNADNETTFFLFFVKKKRSKRKDSSEQNCLFAACLSIQLHSDCTARPGIPTMTRSVTILGAGLVGSLLSIIVKKERI
jgi:hypothetical protein